MTASDEEKRNSVLSGRDAPSDEHSTDAAYRERNQVVAALASLFPSGIARTDIPGWLPEWHGCVYIDLPTGQASWHYHDREAHLFAHLPPYTKPWDGHTTDEKYERVAALAIKPAGAPRSITAHLKAARLFVQDSIENGHDRAVIANLYGARDEIDAAFIVTAANGHHKLVENNRVLRREVGRMVSVLESVIPRLQNVHALLARELEMDLSRLRAVLANLKEE